MADWFALTMNPWELVIRGSIIYLGFILTLRFLLRRDVGTMSVADILFVVLIADAAQNAMSGEYKSIGDGAILVATLVAWNVLLDWASFRSKMIRRFLEPPAVPLIENGRWIRANLRREWITTDEILSKLRERGIEHIEEVEVAYLESSGELGVLRKDDSPAPSKMARRRRGAL